MKKVTRAYSRPKVTKRFRKVSARAYKPSRMKAANKRVVKKKVSAPKKNRPSGFSKKGYSPKLGERTMRGYVGKATKSKEISLYTRSARFNNVKKNGGEFKRFGSKYHGGVHVHKSVRNVSSQGRIFGGAKRRATNKISKKDVKQLHQRLANNKYGRD